ncbi:hypothetical protein EJ110_NYTH00488 [Nymphaea thermarum]|nr:hypothetical protein EJ110_NYTH00488 [Nymphaea thermarum]
MISCELNVSYSFGSRKLEHALKHGSQNGLLVVSLAWFVDSVRQNVRLSEPLYSVRSSASAGLPMEDSGRLTSFSEAENSCLPAAVLEKMESPGMNLQAHIRSFGKDLGASKGSTLAGACIFIDPDISSELHNKVLEAAIREGATFVDKWFIGCKATHVVCEEAFIQRYIGYTGNLVTPLWILKTVKEKRMQRLVHFSADLARQIGMILSSALRLDLQKLCLFQERNGIRWPSSIGISSANKTIEERVEERQQKVDSAKKGIRNRRGRHTQSFQPSIRPITPSSLLDSIGWSISEPASAACVFLDASGAEDVSERAPCFFDTHGDGEGSDIGGDTPSRTLRESEKREVIFKGPFLTILFPVDRFDEMGPSLRTYFSTNGFTCLQILDHIYSFYQENMSADEIELAINTDSRYGDQLRSVYASKRSIENGFVSFKRLNFLGTRKNFEQLKRVGGESGSHVYELLLGS